MARPVLTRRAVLAAAAASLAACAPGDPSGKPSGTGGSPPASVRPAPSVPTLPSATASPAHRGPAQEVSRGPAGDQVALTFHGAGDPALAEQLLAEVERRHGLVTVLAVGTWLQSDRPMAHRVLSAGHELGNHTLHHLPMAGMSQPQAYDEIVGGERVLRPLTGSTGWFRPSGLTRATPAVLAAAGQAGYSTSVSFDVDPHDYADPGSGAVVRRVMASVRPGSIVSLHLGHAGTVAAISELLTQLAARGLRPVTLSQLLVGVHK